VFQEFVCVFADCNHHYTAHYWYVESTREWKSFSQSFFVRPCTLIAGKGLFLTFVGYDFCVFAFSSLFLL